MFNGGAPSRLEREEIEGISFALMPWDGFCNQAPSRFQTRISDSRFPTIWDLANPHPSSNALSMHFDLYHSFARIIYLVSNNLFTPNLIYRHAEKEKAYTDIFDMLNNMPPKLIFNLLKSKSMSIRGMWGKLYSAAKHFRINAGVVLFINSPLSVHSGWIDHDKDCLLVIAASRGDEGLLRHLLARGAKPMHCCDQCSEDSPLTAFGAAAGSGALDCAKMLTESCNMSQGFWVTYNGKRQLTSLLPLFLDDMRGCVGSKWGSRKSRETVPPSWDSTIQELQFFKVLDLLLTAGVNVDSNFAEHGPFDSWGPLHSGYSRDATWMPLGGQVIRTCLDVCYYWYRHFFERLKPYSKEWPTAMTRWGTFMAALHGKESLTEYLGSRTTPRAISQDRYLEFILAEQFHIDMAPERHRAVNADIAQALLEYGVSIVPMGIPFISGNRYYNLDQRFLSAMLHMVVTSAICFGVDEDIKFILAFLIQKGVVLNSGDIAASVGEDGIELLEFLTKFSPNVTEIGTKALVIAVSKHNHEAISWLLRMGVDVNGVVAAECETPLAICMSRRGNGDTCRILIDNGAKLRRYSSDKTCYKLVKAMATCSNFSLCALSREDVFHDFENEMDQLTATDCLDLLIKFLGGSGHLRHVGQSDDETLPRLVHALWKRCDPGQAKSILAAAIKSGCGDSIVQNLLDGGASIHEYSNDVTPLQAAAGQCNHGLVVELLQRGAEINAPARGENGGIALQLACGWYANSVSRGWNLKSELITYMLTQNADVNAPAHGPRGGTALQLICASEPESAETNEYKGKILQLFIDYGANVNAEPGIMSMTALHYCAGRGDLTNVTLLVQHGADPNIHPYIESLLRPQIISSVLDTAASKGFIDMTQYLLNVGALSPDHGETGYRGAMFNARRDNIMRRRN